MTPSRCKFCGAPSWLDPSDQTMPPAYCHPEDHGECPDPHTSDRLQALSAEVERLKAALKRCGEIVENNLYRQHEKIEDVPLIVAQALKGANNG